MNRAFSAGGLLLALVAASALLACPGGGGKGGTGPATGVEPGTGAGTSTPPSDVPGDEGPPDDGDVGDGGGGEPAVPTKVDSAPEFFPPAWKTVGRGQTISFAVTAIDQDLDETAVAVTAMPASARFDALTQTVTWTPTKADGAAGKFTVVATTLATGAQHTWEFEIAIARKKQPAPVAERQSAVIETLLTIREPARLDRVNLDWPFDKMLATSAELFRATLPPEVQAKLPAYGGKAGKAASRALFESFLSALAQTHNNPRLDPKAKEFDKKTFGDPKAWKIVAVRPRIDKKWAELRIVYQAVKAPEPVFAMFRLRPTWDVPTLPPEARAYNNKVFLELVWKHLLEDGKPSEAMLGKPKAHAKAVAALVKALLSHDDSKTQPWARAAFVALPTEARMGGGSARNADGSYRSGDGWAWGVTKPMVNADGTAQAWVNLGIPGFWTDTTASPDGAAWVGKCAPKFHPDDPKHAPGYEVLCRKAQGFVDLPAVVDGKIASAKIDAVNLFVEHKRVDSVARLALEDGRRDHGEENGMTCAQCHIRNFDVRDYGDPATADPRQGTPRGPNKPIETLNFQVIPTTKWEAYTLRFMQDQECKGALAIEQFLGKASGLTCPLNP